ncbi:MAG TPA: pyridoxamine 5'-phosphate oxidase family protein [Gaiellaceae bacterium]
MIEDLNELEIDAFLREKLVGRVGCQADGRTYVVPVIYVWDGEYVYVQSIEGRKVRAMRANPEVCFEVDEYEGGSWRSVILEGAFEELEGSAAEAALALLVQRFVGRRRGAAGARTGRKPVAFRIRSTHATGRRVTRTPAARSVTRLGVAVIRRRARRRSR